MKYPAQIRSLVAAVTVGLLALFFTQLHPEWSAFLADTVAALQFFPALFKAISGNMTGLILLFILIGMTLLFGRIYCAILCPLGIFQDLFISLSKRRPRELFRSPKARRRSRHLAQRLTPIWYTLLGLTAFCLIAGTAVWVNLLDPFSIFGRFFTQLAIPIGEAINNLLAGFFERFEIYRFTPIVHRPILWPMFWVVYGWLILVTILSFYHGRLYCNAVCPVGALFGLISRISFFRFSVNSDNCTRCKKCQHTCRSNCIDVKGKHDEITIDPMRCVTCFDCMEICPENAISYKYQSKFNSMFFLKGFSRINCTRILTLKKKTASPPKKGSHGIEIEKRTLMKRSFTWAAGVAMVSVGVPLRSILAKHGRAILDRRLPVTPPGALGFDHFTATCIACQACVAACPENVLLPGMRYLKKDRPHTIVHPVLPVDAIGETSWRTLFIELKMTPLFQPRLDFSHSRCAYPCNECTKVCPSGAIHPLSVKEKQRTRIGKVVFEENACIVYKYKRDCGACAEVCPTHAVHTIRKENVHFPKIKADACIGCGACELVCPVKPKAIFVNAVRFHERASEPYFQPPTHKKEAGVMGADDAFPF